MSNASPGGYGAARQQLIAFLETWGFRPHPHEVFCPAEHCWVDVGAMMGQDYWAFEYKSRRDSMKRGLEQCCSYSNAFNYVVLVADRQRVTSSPYFWYFKRRGFGVWRHDRGKFYTILNPKRQPIRSKAKAVVERQFSLLSPTEFRGKTPEILHWC
jgi:hypothetical protein